MNSFLEVPLGFVDFFAVNDSGDNLCLCNFFQIVVQEVAVKHRHVGDFSELDGAQAAFLTPLTVNVYRHCAKRLFASDKVGMIKWQLWTACDYRLQDTQAVPFIIIASFI